MTIEVIFIVSYTRWSPRNFILSTGIFQKILYLLQLQSRHTKIQPEFEYLLQEKQEGITITGERFWTPTRISWYGKIQKRERRKHVKMPLFYMHLQGEQQANYHAGTFNTIKSFSS
jgi:hypothetical protein